jgi:CheY-like chemotaxis protein
VGRVQEFDRKAYDKEVAMKAAAHSYKCMVAVPGDAKSGIRPSLHTPRRRSSAARSLRQCLAEALGIEQQLGKRIRSIELMPLEALVPDQALAGAGGGVKRVLLVDADMATATVLATLLVPEAQVVHVATLAEAHGRLKSEIFSAVVLDPCLPDGDAADLLPALCATPLLVYSVRQPDWRGVQAAYLPKPWTSPRQLWVTISGMLGIAGNLSAGD